MLQHGSHSVPQCQVQTQHWRALDNTQDQRLEALSVVLVRAGCPICPGRSSRWMKAPTAPSTAPTAMHKQHKQLQQEAGPKEPRQQQGLRRCWALPRLETPASSQDEQPL